MGCVFSKTSEPEPMPEPKPELTPAPSPPVIEAPVVPETAADLAVRVNLWQCNQPPLLHPHIGRFICTNDCRSVECYTFCLCARCAVCMAHRDEVIRCAICRRTPTKRMCNATCPHVFCVDCVVKHLYDLREEMKRKVDEAKAQGQIVEKIIGTGIWTEFIGTQQPALKCPADEGCDTMFPCFMRCFKQNYNPLTRFVQPVLPADALETLPPWADEEWDSDELSN